MTKQITDEQAEAGVAKIERQLASALEHLGKVQMPTARATLNRSMTVEAKKGVTIHVVVTYEQTKGFNSKPTGLYSVLVQEVRNADSRIKYRARGFEGLPPKLTGQQVETIVACVGKHLAARSEVELETRARNAERKRREQREAERHERLNAIGQAYGIRNSDHGTMISTGFTARCNGDSFTVTIDSLSEAELRGFLDFWTTRKEAH